MSLNILRVTKFRYIGPMTIRDFTCMKLIATEKKDKSCKWILI